MYKVRLNIIKRKSPSVNLGSGVLPKASQWLKADKYDRQATIQELNLCGCCKSELAQRQFSSAESHHHASAIPGLRTVGDSTDDCAVSAKCSVPHSSADMLHNTSRLENRETPSKFGESNPQDLALKLDFLTLLAQFLVLGLWVLALMIVWYLLKAEFPIHLLICCTMAADLKKGKHQTMLVNPSQSTSRNFEKILMVLV